MDYVKRLYRSREDSIIGGVCGGIAEHLNIDPVWVRLAAVLAIFANGIGIILYLIAWILIPENPAVQDNAKNGKKNSEKSAKKETEKNVKPQAENNKKTMKQPQNGSHVIFGILILTIGAFMLMHNMGYPINWKIIAPIGLIGLGLIMIIGRRKR